MGLGIYNSTNADDVLDSGNPFTITFDGREGGILDKCVYIHNDDIGSWFENIQIVPVGIYNSTWWLLEKDTVPINEDWESITPGASLALSSNIGSSTTPDIATYLPVWIRVQVPEGSNIQTITSITLRLIATRNLI